MPIRFEREMKKLKPEAIKKIEVLYDKPAKDFLRLAVTLANLRKGTTAKLHKVVKDAGGVMSEETPLAIPSRKNPNEVTVFPNIKANATAETVAQFLLEILNNPKTEVKLQTPERCIKMALKREKTTLARLITEHSDLAAKGKRADQIQQVGDRAAAAFAKTRIVECKTPTDCYIAYSTDVPGSCMKKGSTYFGDWTSKTWIQIAEDTGFYPSAWYLFQPYAKLCYLEVGGKPVARFMLYRKDVTKEEWPFWGDLKRSTNEFGKIVEEEMKKHGRTSIYSTETVAPYEVPALFHSALKGGKVPHCPLPFADSQTRDFSVWYDADKKVFIFDKTKNKAGGLVINNNYDHRGYIDGSKVPLVKRSVEAQPEVVAEPVKAEPAQVAEVKKAPKPAPVALPEKKKRTCMTCTHLEVKGAACAKCDKDKLSIVYHDKWEPRKKVQDAGVHPQEVAPKKAEAPKVPAIGGAKEVVPVRQEEAKPVRTAPAITASAANQYIVEVG